MSSNQLQLELTLGNRTFWNSLINRQVRLMVNVPFFSYYHELIQIVKESIELALSCFITCVMFVNLKVIEWIEGEDWKEIRNWRCSSNNKREKTKKTFSFLSDSKTEFMSVKENIQQWINILFLFKVYKR